MWIRNTNPGTSMLFNPAILDKPVYFKNGKAQVSDEVGALMIEKYHTVEALRKPRKPRKPKSSKLDVTMSNTMSGDITGSKSINEAKEGDEE